MALWYFLARHSSHWSSSFSHYICLLSIWNKIWSNSYLVLVLQTVRMPYILLWSCLCVWENMSTPRTVLQVPNVNAFHEYATFGKKAKPCSPLARCCQPYHCNAYRQQSTKCKHCQRCIFIDFCRRMRIGRIEMFLALTIREVLWTFVEITLHECGDEIEFLVPFWLLFWYARNSGMWSTHQKAKYMQFTCTCELNSTVCD